MTSSRSSSRPPEAEAVDPTGIKSGSDPAWVRRSVWPAREPLESHDHEPRDRLGTELSKGFHDEPGAEEGGEVPAQWAVHADERHCETIALDVVLKAPLVQVGRRDHGELGVDGRGVLRRGEGMNECDAQTPVWSQDPPSLLDNSTQIVDVLE